MRGSPGITEDLYVRALKRNLARIAEGGIFSGDLRKGWHTFWCAVRMHPVLTIFQFKTLIFVARTVLGARGYQAARSLLRRNHESTAPA
jgi:hypothetical protein